MSRRLLLLLHVAWLGCASGGSTGSGASSPAPAPGGAPSEAAPGGRPVWIDDRAPAEYPADRFLLGYGSTRSTADRAQDQARADAAARAALAAKLKVQVTEVLSAVEAEAGGKSMVAAARRTEQSVDMSLEGVEIREHFVDPEVGVTYALAVLDKRKAKARLEATIQDELTRADELEAKAGGTREAVARLGLLGKAHGHRLRAGGAQAFLRLLGVAGGAPVSLGALEAEITKLASSLTLEADPASQRQRALPKKPLDVPLTLTARLAGEGVAGLPIELEGGDAELARDVVTDARGLARSEVRAAPTAVDGARIVARVAWAKLVDGPIAAALPAREVNFELVLRSAERTRVALAIAEEIQGGPGGTRFLEDALRQSLGARGLDVRDPGGRVGPGDLAAPSATGAKKLAEVADIAVLGRVEAVPSSVQGGKIFWFRAHGTISAIETQTGRVVGTFACCDAATDENKGYGTSEAQAGRSALKRFAEALGPKVAEDVLRGL